MFEIDALEAFGISIDVDYVWDNTVKCDLRLQITYDVDCDGWQHGMVSIPGICLSSRKLLELCKQIEDWKERQADAPCAFTGTFDLSVIPDVKTEFTFCGYIDIEEKTRGEF